MPVVQVSPRRRNRAPQDAKGTTMNRTNRSIVRPALTALAAAIVLSAGIATATQPAPSAAATAAVQPPQVVERLQQKGYSDVHDVEWDDGAWEADATSPAGEQVDLRISPETGDVLSEEAD
jgi:hypothetical protein